VNDPHVDPLSLATFCAGEFAERDRPPPGAIQVREQVREQLFSDRPHRQLLAQRWRKYDLARYTEACSILPELS
jgi:hypothetical protein